MDDMSVCGRICPVYHLKHFMQKTVKVALNISAACNNFNATGKNYSIFSKMPSTISMFI